MPYNNSALLAIKNELLTDPAARGYSGKSDAECAKLISEPLSQSPQVFSGMSINPQTIALVLIKRGKWEAVKSAADTLAAAGHADAFKLYHLATLSSIADDFTGAQLAAIINGLITAGVLVAADGNAIRDASRQEVLKSRLAVLGLGNSCDAGDIAAARVAV